MKKISRSLLIAAVVTCVTCLLCVSALAATTIGVTADKTSADPGDTVNVTVSIPQNDGFTVLNFNVDFDPDVFDYVSDSLTGAFPAWPTQPGYESGNSVGYTLGNALSSGITTTGTAATVTLRVKDTAPTGNSSTITVRANLERGSFNDLDEITVTGGSCAVNINAPVEPSPTATVEPSESPDPTATTEPSESPEPSATTEPTNAPVPTNAPTPVPGGNSNNRGGGSSNNSRGAKDNVLQTGEADYLPILAAVGLAAVVAAVILLRKKHVSRT